MMQSPDSKDIQAIAQSPAGKAITEYLRTQPKGSTLETALESASAGDMQQAQSALESLFSGAEGKMLLWQLQQALGGDSHG